VGRVHDDEAAGKCMAYAMRELADDEKVRLCRAQFITALLLNSTACIVINFTNIILDRIDLDSPGLK
jgi:hypothetical protein